MSKFSYLVKRALSMDYGKLIKIIRKIQKINHKPALTIFLDMKDCAVKYGAGFNDYDLYEMYNMNDQQRDTVITRGRNDLLVKKYNDPAYKHYFDNKSEFNQYFKEFTRRDFVFMNTASKEEVFAFFKKHDVFFAKEDEGTGGIGIEKIYTKDHPDYEELYQHLSGRDMVLEEAIIQCETMNRLYPNSINTARIVTVVKDGQAHVICAYSRIGNGGFVDNFHSHGMACPIDEETGIIKGVGYDRDENTYEVHPLTQTKILGFKMPNWQEALELVKKAALVVPQIGYVGWDVGFAVDGPIIIEGNTYPGHDIYQLPAHTPDKIGMWPKFKVYL